MSSVTNENSSDVREPAGAGPFLEYELPAELIAQRPVEPRDASRLLVVDRRTGALDDRRFRDLPAVLEPGDLLVFNDSRVIPARLTGRFDTGGRAELLLLRQVEEDVWECLTRPARRFAPGRTVRFGDSGLVAVVERYAGPGIRHVRFTGVPSVRDELFRLGEAPLPPYVKARDIPLERYQTIYARRDGSAAAPTAGLHFTERLLDELAARGIEFAYVTLHVGLDTFRPITEARVEDHRIHAEWMEIPEAEATRIDAALRAGRRVVAVGTTSVRALESAWEDGRVRPGRLETRLFIRPGYRFRVVGALLTNFHLPRTTLLLLVSAFAGTELTRAAYEHAIRERYRFYSFGDAMLVL